MTRGVTFILQSILFRVVPTALEISLVCGILVRWLTTLSHMRTLTMYMQTYKFGWDYAAITLATMAAYTWYTVRTTAWR